MLHGFPGTPIFSSSARSSRACPWTSPIMSYAKFAPHRLQPTACEIRQARPRLEQSEEVFSIRRLPDGGRYSSSGKRCEKVVSVNRPTCHPLSQRRGPARPCRMHGGTKGSGGPRRLRA
jgi:hypothetical protein